MITRYTTLVLGTGIICIVSMAARAQTPADRDALVARLQQLEKRVTELEKLRIFLPSSDARTTKPGTGSTDTLPTSASATGTVTRVQAPFEVVDRQGRPIARILDWSDQSGGVYAYNAAGKIVAVLGPINSQNGGRVAVYDGSGRAFAGTLAYSPEGAAIELPRGFNEHGILINAGTGELNIYNTQGYASVALKTGQSGAGRVTLGDVAGNTVVEAGSTAAGIGIVRVGPRLGGTSGVTQSGLLLPNAIVGRK
jgi:hypothetical protein